MSIRKKKKGEGVRMVYKRRFRSRERVGAMGEEREG